MPTVRISKIKVRRGSDDQRKFMVFDQGELIYTADTKRLFIGTGTLSGGSVVGSKIHPILNNYYSLSSTNAQIGDIVNVNNKFYQLTAVNYKNILSWADVSTKINSTFFNYDSGNKLDLNSNSISAKYIKSSTVSNGLKIENGILQTKYNTRSFEISAYELSLKADGVSEREINTTTLGNGLTGGSGVKLSLKANPDYFYFDSTSALCLSVTHPLTLTFDKLSSSWFSQGLLYDDVYNTISTVLTDVDNVSLVRNLTGGVSINTIATSGTNQWSQNTIDQFGRVIDQVSSIYGALTGNSSLGSFNVSNTLSALFDGSPSQSLSGAIPGTQLTNFTATDITGATVTLSSAGFITFEGPTTTRNGSTVGRFAIPIFTY